MRSRLTLIEQFSPTTWQVVWCALNFAACIPVLVAVGLFSLYHFYLLATNTTTIEAWEKDKVAMLVRRGRIEKIKFPYNLGVLQNIRYVLGSNPLVWCWPTLRVQGDGLSYPVEAGTEEHVQYLWPPKDPTSYYEPRPLPETPWTYGSGVNPHLEPSNARLRSKASSRNTAGNQGGAREMDSFTRFLKSLDNDEPDSRTPSPASSDLDSGANIDDGAIQARRQPRTGDQISDEEADSDAYDTKTGRPKARRGSEGWEVKPLTPWAREEIVRKYAARRGLGQEEGPVPGSAVDQEHLPESRSDDVSLRAQDAPAQPQGTDLEDESSPTLDKYNRYIPSAEDSSSSDDGNPPSEGRFRDRLWEQHIDVWEGRVIANGSGAAAGNGTAGETHGIADADSALEEL